MLTTSSYSAAQQWQWQHQIDLEMLSLLILCVAQFNSTIINLENIALQQTYSLLMYLKQVHDTLLEDSSGGHYSKQLASPFASMAHSYFRGLITGCKVNMV